MALFRPKSPVSPKAEAWIEQSLDWLTGQFGDGYLRADILLPDEIDEYTEDQAGAQRLLAIVSAHMGASMAAVDLQVLGEVPSTRRSARRTSDDGELGTYERVGDRSVIAVPDSLLKRPVALVATLAHEIAHVRLIGENRVTSEQYDQEQLTDLATVFFGLGIFTANAAYDYTQTATGARTMIASTSRLGYLGEEMCGYALASFAFRRGEPDPFWASQLDLNPRAYLKQGLRYLEVTRR